MNSVCKTSFSPRDEINEETIIFFQFPFLFQLESICVEFLFLFKLLWLFTASNQSWYVNNNDEKYFPSIGFLLTLKKYEPVAFEEI